MSEESTLQLRHGWFHVFVRAEEQGGAGSAAGRGGPHASIDPREAPRGEKAVGGLKARFEGVDGVEGQIDGGAGQSAGEEGC